MTHPRLFMLGAAVLMAAWVWPLPSLDTPPFSTHMMMHMAVVAGAAPLLSLGIAGGRFDPVVRAPGVCSAIVASMLELVAVWAWHAPALHRFARHDALGLVLEQATFLTAGVALWIAALGGTATQRRARAFSGVAGLLLTSMHMTLLGALIALSPRTLYPHTHHDSGWPSLMDQQLGGAIMLIWGMVAYLAGGVGLAGDLVRSRRNRQEPVRVS